MADRIVLSKIFAFLSVLCSCICPLPAIGIDREDEQATLDSASVSQEISTDMVLDLVGIRQ